MPADAQTYPTRPVKIIVGFAAGGTVDAVTRIYADRLSQHFDKQFVVENMPGGGSHIAAAVAAKAPPDGYTLLLVTNANTTGVSLYEKLNYQFPDDFAPIALLAGAPSVLVASPTLKVNSVKELIELAKAKPTEVLYGSAGIGTATHMAAEMFQMGTQTKLTHVPYKALSGAMMDLTGGRLSILFSPLGTVAGAMKEGQLTGLAVTSPERTAFAPELPTLAESGVPEFDVKLWIGLVAPKGTPNEVVDSLIKAIQAIQTNDALKPQLFAAGAEPLSSYGAAFGTFMRKDVDVWRKVVEYAGVKIK